MFFLIPGFGAQKADSMNVYRRGIALYQQKGCFQNGQKSQKGNTKMFKYKFSYKPILQDLIKRMVLAIFLKPIHKF